MKPWMWRREKKLVASPESDISGSLECGASHPVSRVQTGLGMSGRHFSVALRPQVPLAHQPRPPKSLHVGSVPCSAQYLT